MSAKPRNEVIDGFRGVAIATVMVYHYGFRWQSALGLSATPAWLQLGALGVQIFFVISGLVIAMTLLRSHDALNFLIRRAARLLPVFWTAGTAIFLILRAVDPLRFAPTVKDWAASLTFMPYELHQDYVDKAFWSLNVEVKFYVLAALCYAALRGRFWMGLVAFALLGSAVHLRTDAYQQMLFLGPYMPFFLWGLALWYSCFDPDRRAAWSCGGAALVSYALHWKFYGYPGVAVWLPHVYLAATIGLLTLLIARAPETPTGPLAWLGRRSYSLYLIHQRLGVTLIALLLGAGLAPWAALATAAVAAIAVAWALYALVELPGQAAILRAFDFRLRDAKPHVLPQEPAKD